MHQAEFEILGSLQSDTTPLFYEEESNIQIFSPQQPGLFKKASYWGEEFDLKHSIDCSTTEQSEESEHQPSSTVSFPSKLLPPPSNADYHLFNLPMRYYPNTEQENFIRNFISHDDLQRIKIGLNEELLNHPETIQFENWVQRLCNTKANQKEQARKLKVKRYLEKKRKRTYEKKVHYQVRQKVAEERLRIKGRFVTWKQAVKMLDNAQTKRAWTNNDYFKIKSLLNEKYGDSVN